MSKALYSRFRLAEANHTIPEGSATALTYATILELGVRAAAEGYYGNASVNEATGAAKNEQLALDIADDTLADIAAITKVYSNLERFIGEQTGAGFKALNTTSDFPTALANLRARTIRQDLPIAQPSWRSWIPARMVGTTPDFKPIRGLSMTEMGELLIRPEATDVQYTSMGWTSDHFMIANYERALQYTWEAWLNDEIDAFGRALRRLGEGAKRTEAIVVLNAILNGVSRSSESGITTGGPTATNLSAARAAMAARTITDIDGVATIGAIVATDLVVPSVWTDTAALALNTQWTNFVGGTPNVSFNSVTPHTDRLMGRVFASDWILFDNTIDFIDVRFLQGFEGGPMTYTKMPDVNEHPDQGSFANHALSVKVGHALGAKIVNAQGVLRNQGA